MLRRMRVYRNVRSRKIISTVCFLTVGESKKVPSVVADGKKAVVAATGRRAGVERRRREKKSTRDELGGAALHSKQII